MRKILLLVVAVLTSAFVMAEKIDYTSVSLVSTEINLDDEGAAVMLSVDGEVPASEQMAAMYGMLFTNVINATIAKTGDPTSEQKLDAVTMAQWGKAIKLVSGDLLEYNTNYTITIKMGGISTTSFMTMDDVFENKADVTLNFKTLEGRTDPFIQSAKFNVNNGQTIDLSDATFAGIKLAVKAKNIPETFKPYCFYMGGVRLYDLDDPEGNYVFCNVNTPVSSDTIVLCPKDKLAEGKNYRLVIPFESLYVHNYMDFTSEVCYFDKDSVEFYTAYPDPTEDINVTITLGEESFTVANANADQNFYINVINNDYLGGMTAEEYNSMYYIPYASNGDLSKNIAEASYSDYYANSQGEYSIVVCGAEYDAIRKGCHATTKSVVYPLTIGENGKAIIANGDRYSFDFSNPESFGFEMPEEGSFTNVEDADTLVSGAAMFINEKNGSIKVFSTTYYKTKFQKNDGLVDLLIQRKTVVKFEGDGRNIKKIEFKGSVLDGDKTFSSGYYYVADDNTAYWLGDDSIVTMTMGSPAEMRISSMTMELGEASGVRYPEFSSTGDILYADVTTPFVVSLSCSTEGAELYYKFEGDEEWTSYTSEGIEVNESCRIWAKAVKDGVGSQSVCANYYVLPTYKVASQSEFEQLEESAMAVTTTPLTVIYNWHDDFYNIILASDGEKIFNINDRDLEIADPIAQGTIIKSGLAGSMFHTGYMSFKPSFELLPQTLATDGISEEPILPDVVSIDEIAANPSAFYNRYLQISGAELEFVKTRNYKISDGSDTTITMYDRFLTVPASLEDDRYDICGVLINNGTMDQFYPVSLKACVPVAILTGTVGVERTISVGRASVGKVGLDWGDGEIVWQMTSVDEVWGDPVPAEFNGIPVEEGEILIYGDGITYIEAYGKMNDDVIINPLLAVDVTNATDLEELYLNTNRIGSIDLSNNLKLKTLNLAKNLFESIDITANTALTSFTADENSLTSIDLSKNASLTSVMLNNNRITAIDFSNNHLMKTFQCLNNELESVIIGSNTAKNHTLQFGGNKLSCIDLSSMTNISGAYLRLRDNRFTSAADIILPKDAKVKQIWIDGNAMTLSELYALKAMSTGTFTYATTFSGDYAQLPMEIAETYAAGETIDLSSEYMLGSTATVYTWYNDSDEPLVEGVDYTESNGVFTFNAVQDKIRCSLSNTELSDFTVEKPFVTTWTSITPATRINVVDEEIAIDGKYNLKGVMVDDSYNGVIIFKGKKYVR